jgi:hypothetical protein
LKLGFTLTPKNFVYEAVVIDYFSADEGGFLVLLGRPVDDR